MKITLSTTCLKWARERSGFSPAELAAKMQVDGTKVQAWEADGELTMAQADKLARVTHTPIGYLFLPEPPVERLPVRDFRTVATGAIANPSPELLDTMNEALRRQNWYRQYAQSQGADPLTFIGSLSISGDIAAAVAHIRRSVTWDGSARAEATNWEQALSRQIEAVEAAGILVMRNGIVGNNTGRPLDVNEFRGFALSDLYAPLLFINVKDAKAAQMFTLAHELVHLFLGVSGVSNLAQTYAPSDSTEQFCNAVAAELLVPLAELRTQWSAAQSDPDALAWLGRRFKVSSLVVLRRLRDADILTDSVFQARYATELAQFDENRSVGGGGSFYLALRSRLGRRFASAVVESVLEGNTLYRDAFQLLGVNSAENVRKLAEEVGAAA